MSCMRVLVCFLFPPLAVIDKGCGSILLVSILTRKTSGERSVQ